MNVSAIIVTRGNVPLQPIIDSLPPEWEILEWDNEGIDGDTGPGLYRNHPNSGEVEFLREVPDLSVYGRYAAIEYASHDLIYVQDDDVIVSDPQAIVDTFIHTRDFCAICQGPMTRQETTSGHVVWACEEKHCVPDELVANMPQEFRHDGYTDSCLVGFGAVFHRDAPGRAFERFFAGNPARDLLAFNRTCDVLFTTLTPRVLMDIEKIDREFATDPSRMYRQPGHVAERREMLDLARQVRDS